MTTAPLPAVIEKDRLTEILRNCGALPRGGVSEVTVESSRPTIMSRIIRLRLTYDDADGDALASLILKTGLPRETASGWVPGRQEVAFYRRSRLPRRRASCRAASTRIGMLKTKPGTSCSRI